MIDIQITGNSTLGFVAIKQRLVIDNQDIPGRRQVGLPENSRRTRRDHAIDESQPVAFRGDCRRQFATPRLYLARARFCILFEGIAQIKAAFTHCAFTVAGALEDFRSQGLAADALRFMNPIEKVAQQFGAQRSAAEFLRPQDVFQQRGPLVVVSRHDGTLRELTAVYAG